MDTICTWKCAFRNVILFHNKWAERFGKFRFYFITELSCWVTVLIFRLFLVILSYTSKKLSVSAISFHWTGKSLVGADPKNTVVLIVLRRAELVDLDFPFSIEFSKTHYSWTIYPMRCFESVSYIEQLRFTIFHSLSAFSFLKAPLITYNYLIVYYLIKLLI